MRYFSTVLVLSLFFVGTLKAVTEGGDCDDTNLCDQGLTCSEDTKKCVKEAEVQVTNNPVQGTENPGNGPKTPSPFRGVDEFCDMDAKEFCSSKYVCKGNKCTLAQERVGPNAKCGSATIGKDKGCEKGHFCNKNNKCTPKPKSDQLKKVHDNCGDVNDVCGAGLYCDKRLPRKCIKASPPEKNLDCSKPNIQCPEGQKCIKSDSLKVSFLGVSTACIEVKRVAEHAICQLVAGGGNTRFWGRCNKDLVCTKLVSVQGKGIRGSSAKYDLKCENPHPK